MAAACALMSLAPAQTMKAQDTEDSQSIQTQNRASSARRSLDPAKMAENRANMMVKRYGLTAEQGNKLKVLFQSEQTEMQKQMKQQKTSEMTDEQRAVRHKEMQERKTKLDAQIKEILTDEQYQKYTADKKNRQTRRFQRVPGDSQTRDAQRARGEGGFGGNFPDTGED